MFEVTLRNRAVCVFSQTTSIQMYRPRNVKRPPAASNPAAKPAAKSSTEEGVFKPRVIKRKGTASQAPSTAQTAALTPKAPIQSVSEKAAEQEERVALELLFSTLQMCFSDYALSIHRSGGLLDQLRHNAGGCESFPFDFHRLTSILTPS